MKTATIDIKTPDGLCDAYVAYPDEKGSFPGVIFYPDAYGLRDWVFEMVKTIAERGYYVVAPNTFYRKRRAPVLDVTFPVTMATREAAFAQIMPLIQSFTPEMALKDAGALVEHLARSPRVRQGGIGVTGYCMGGGLALRTAAAFPEQVIAAATFHAGRLANDAETSPHRQFHRIRAELYLAHADHDQSMPPEMIERVAKALDEAKVTYRAELYRGALHGFTQKDLPVYNEAALSRHWVALFDLLERKLA